MLEIVFDRLVRLMTRRCANFTSDNVEVSLDRITSVRFGDYMNSIRCPPCSACSRPRKWENFGLATVDSSLIYSMVDVLLGGRRGQTSLRIEGRPYTSIETNLVKRLSKWCWPTPSSVPAAVAGELLDRPAGNQSALRPPSAGRQRRHPGAPAHRHGRPRRQHRTAAALRDHRADPSRAAADVHGREIRAIRSGKAISPPKWDRRNFRRRRAPTRPEIPLKQLMKLKVGDTLPLDMRADALVAVRCGNVLLTKAGWGASATASPSASPSSCASPIPPRDVREGR